MLTNEKKNYCIIIGTAHGQDVKGKCSPDGKFKEYIWSRKICKRLLKRLQDDGYRAVIDSDALTEIGLSNRAQIVNNYCSIFGAKNTVYISIHNNAAPPNDSKWHKAQGWCVFVAPTASANSKKLASYLAEEIESQGIKIRRPLPKQDWWEGKFTVLTKTKCPAVLTENMFQDNHEDVEFLMSEEGQQKLLDVHVNAIERYINDMKIR